MSGKSPSRKIISYKKRPAETVSYDQLIYSQMYNSLGQNIQNYVEREREKLKSMGKNKSNKLVAAVQHRLINFIKTKSSARKIFNGGKRNQFLNSVEQDYGNPMTEQRIFDQKKLYAEIEKQSEKKKTYEISDPSSGIINHIIETAKKARIIKGNIQNIGLGSTHESFKKLNSTCYGTVSSTCYGGLMSGRRKAHKLYLNQW